MTLHPRRQWQQRERVEERGEAIDRKTGDRRDEGQRDAEAVRREAYRKQPALLADAARLPRIADEPLIVRGVEKDAGEGHRDEDRTESVDDERGRRAVLREDVLTDQRGRKRNDPDGDQQQEVEVEEAPVDALAVLEERVVIHPDDADGEEAHEVGRIRRPQSQERSAQIGCVGGYTKLEDEESSRDREDAVAECFEPARPHCT